LGEQGHKAVHQLSSSLTSIKKLLTIMQHIYTDQEREAFFEEPESTKVEMPVLPTDRAMRGLRHPNYFIYNHCLSVSACHSRNSKHLPVYSACVVLNLALAHHRLGIKGNRAALNKAESLYSMALQLLNLPYPASTSEIILSMKIIAVNNLAQVHQETGAFEESNIFIRQLSLLLQTMVSTGTFFSEQDFNKLVLNVMLCGPPMLAAAA